MDAAPEMDGVAGESVVVIGGGFGGLSTACYLADAGADVTLLEKNGQLGGRASRLEADGFRFDMGPSWYLMPDVFERFFGHFGRSPEEYYSLTHLDPHYRVFWKDGDRVDVLPDMDHNRELFESYESGAGDALDAYLRESKRTYEIGMEHFVYEDRPRLRDYVDTDVLRYSWGLSLLGKMQGHVEGYFDHPKLQQLMQYTLVFLGGSPTNTPALYNLMSHVDFNMGVYYPDGGIGAVVDGIVELADELGVEFVTDAEVTAIEGRRGGFAVEVNGGGAGVANVEREAREARDAVTGEAVGDGGAVADGDGGTAAANPGDDGANPGSDGATRYLADLVVSNADYAHTERELLPPEKRQYTEEYWESRTFAPSAFLLYLGVEGDVDELAHHTLVLPTEWDEHFAQIFDDPAWPDDPAYYLCVPSETDDAVAPEGHSNLFALVPIAPGLEDTPERRAEYRDLVLDDIAENTGTDLRDRIVFEETFSVEDFADRYNSYQGSALGLAHTLRQTSLLRPPHRSSEVDGLYFTGATTTPGIGVPMCLISGGLTAERIADTI